MVPYNNIEWAALYSNLRRVQQIWGTVEKVLGKTGTPINTRAMIYKALVRTVILYGSEIWVVMNKMMTLLEVHHQNISIPIVVMK